MEWLRRLFTKNQNTSSMIEGDEESFLTRDEAAEFVAREIHRDLIVSDFVISYVRYSDDFDDYCRVRIKFDYLDRGTYTIQLLPLEDRTPEEAIDDAKILDLLRRDRRLNAVRLCRHLHQCSLADAIQRVAELEQSNSNNDVPSSE